MTSSSRLASDNYDDQPMDAYLDQADTTYSRKHTSTTLIKEEQDRHNPHPQYRSRATTLGGTSSAYHHFHSHQQHQHQQAEVPVEIYRDPSPDAADSFDQRSHHPQQNTMDPDYGDQENIRPRPRAATVGDLRAQTLRDKDASSSSSSSSHPYHQPALQRRPSARTELLERSRPQIARPVSSSSSQAGTHQQQQTRETHAPLVRKRSVYAMEEDSSSHKTGSLEQTREQLKQTHVGKSAAGPSRVDAPKKQRREAGLGAAGQQQQAQQNGGQAARRVGSSTQKQGEEGLTEEELKEVERKRRHYLRQYADDISYGNTYEDNAYEYRNVILPKAIFQWLPRHYFVNLDTAGFTLKLLSGLQMSPGWEHYMQHAPEPHIMPFRRDLETSRRVRLEQALAAARDKKEGDVKIKTERP
ncbi:hypothetical protein BGZ82_003764 [Podila clonocystis]|nr:hypothetical protein BGZ82_003764 [Podila clonocystis]